MGRKIRYLVPPCQLYGSEGSVAGRLKLADWNTVWSRCVPHCLLVKAGEAHDNFRYTIFATKRTLYPGNKIAAHYLCALILNYAMCQRSRYWYLTLRLLMSYIYGAPSRARNANVVYIWTYFWQRWNSLFLFAAQCFNTESMQRGFLRHICV